MELNRDKIMLFKLEELLKSARNIFGNIVCDAYIESPSYEVYEKYHKRDIVCNKDHIEYDGLTIVLVFINNKVVVFQNSEWASIVWDEDTEKDVMRYINGLKNI